jgi:hypothetical protein
VLSSDQPEGDRNVREEFVTQKVGRGFLLIILGSYAYFDFLQKHGMPGQKVVYDD